MIFTSGLETLVSNKTKPTKRVCSQIKISEMRQTQNVNFRFMPNAFQILKPIQSSSKRIGVLPTAGTNGFAKN